MESVKKLEINKHIDFIVNYGKTHDQYVCTKILFF